MNKNVRRMVVNGLGVAAGAVLAAVSSMATASADKHITVDNNSTPVAIDAEKTPTYTDVNVVDSSAVNIENNHVYTNTDIIGGAADTSNAVNLDDNTRPTNLELSASAQGAQNVVHVDGDTGATNLEIDTSAPGVGNDVQNHVLLIGDHGPTNVDIDSASVSGTNAVAMDDSFGLTHIDITDLATGANALLGLEGNSGRVVSDITVGNNASSNVDILANSGPTVTYLNSGSSDVSTNTIGVYANTQLTTINLDHEGEATNIYVGSGYPTYDGNPGAVVINDPHDVSPVYVWVALPEDGNVIGTVTAHMDGVTTVIPAGDEYEFVNGSVDIISTTLP